jgi:hypothetical protein
LLYVGISFIHLFICKCIYPKIAWSAWKRCIPVIQNPSSLWSTSPWNSDKIHDKPSQYLLVRVCECWFIQGFVLRVVWRLHSSYGSHFLFAFGSIKYGCSDSSSFIALGFTCAQLAEFQRSSFEHFRQSVLHLKYWNFCFWFSLYIYCVI